MVLNQTAFLTDGKESRGAVEYSGGAIPWFAAPLGEKADLYLSGGISARYDGEKWGPLPELYRTSLTVNPGPAIRLEIGRVPWGESASLVCAGLFDGISSGIALGGGRLNAGVFYTGLLYKKTANINLSSHDYLDYHNSDRYFASRRLATSLGWQAASVFGTGSGLSLNGLCQFDLNDTDKTVHSQYLEGKFTMPLGIRFNTLYGAVCELAEETGKDPYAAFAFSAELQWLLPGALPDMLRVSGRFSSGAWTDGQGPFIPLTGTAQGKILRPVLSGAALTEAAYTARLARAFSAAFSAAYYFRTDKITYTAADMDVRSESPFIGAEIYGGFTWSPFSEIVFSLGGGVFLPQTGKVFADNAKLKYRLEAALGISL
ncbi:hypothetical protein AGMMS50268_08650 [Spirochaetia bacterium]|nr:hypothetical protein AGMMS50268_08650 [Spirochaetia bacterium]